MTKKKKQTLTEMLDKMREPRLYILMRSDLDSLTPGRKMAMASHATNAFLKNVNQTTDKRLSKLLDHWENETPQGFGTAIVLESKDVTPMYIAITSFKNALQEYHKACAFGIVNDPDYIVKDGNIGHHISIDTCAYFFFDTLDTELKDLLSEFPLHP